VGGTTGGMFETERELFSGSTEPLDPRRVARLMAFPLSTTSELLSRAFGAERTATICSACSSSGIAIAEALAWLSRGEVDVALAGGADGLCHLTLTGFNSLGATDPEPCRPFDRSRNGLNLGEGAAFLVLERESAARARGAKILGFVSGAAVLAEAHHITHPEPSGERAAELLRRAIERAGLRARDVGYVNAHGTGTRQNDAMEAAALRRVFGDELSKVAVSSTKSQLGHTLGAAAAVEAVITLLSLEAGLLPPTSGLVEPEAPELRHVMDEALPLAVESACSSSFGFGGMSSVLVLQRADAEDRRSACSEPSALFFTGTAEFTGDALPELDAERSRRFDRAAAASSFASERALRGAGLEGDETGLVVGSAFGNVERSIRFLSRVAERGPKFANPAEFPHLVASAAAGNASVYAGFRGPVLTASERELAGEAALSRAVCLFELPGVDAVVSGAVSARDPIVDQVLGVSPGDGLPRGEGAAFVTLERERSAKARGARALGRLVRHREIRRDLLRALDEEGPPGAGSALVLGSTSAALRAALERTAWGQVRRADLLQESGRHEALGAFAQVLALRWLSSGEHDDVLIVSGSEQMGYLTRLAAPGGAG
jgi:3-oxoacyl-[acyl-carrier-protein] synthase II